MSPREWNQSKWNDMVLADIGVTLRRIEPGLYETHDRLWGISRTEYDGPRGGRKYVWEVIHREDKQWNIVEGPRSTLAEAKLYLIDCIIKGGS